MNSRELVKVNIQHSITMSRFKIKMEQNKSNNKSWAVISLQIIKDLLNKIKWIMSHLFNKTIKTNM